MELTPMLPMPDIGLLGNDRPPPHALMERIFFW